MINVLSLFDGMACSRIALDRLGIKCNYWASEIDKYAIKIAQKNYPDIIHVGDIRQIKEIHARPIHLLIGGSPCQDLSISKHGRKGLKGHKSSLFWEYIRIKNKVKPKYFILENVASMRSADRDIITKALGVEPIMIDSELVSAQSRKRYYWTNIEGITQPKDKHIKLEDIIETGHVDRIKSYCIDASYFKGASFEFYKRKNKRQLVMEYKNDKGFTKELTKSRTLSAWNKSLNQQRTTAVINFNNREAIARKLTPLECERLQTVPEGYTKGVSNTQRYRMLGNGFTVDIIRHILSFAKW